ncbi:MAG: hypothetical protein GTO18_15280 [Anaerolineales bacterium]|nr:hypothetical protein [Anaerolineales bacterium]
MTDFSLLLFSTDPEFIAQSVSAGVEGIVVDWENIGKDRRQAFADTQINRDTLDDLIRVRASTKAKVICRINRFGESTHSEVEQAVSAGADELLLPMVRTATEVEKALELVRDRSGLGILVETLSAVRTINELSQLPLSRIYVGLMDLAIEREMTNIFMALADGTVETIRQSITCPFGFGGLTLPDRGYPIPCRLLIAEMVRLRCDFSFLRRSFHRDIRGKDPNVEIPRLSEALQKAKSRSKEEVAQDHADLLEAIHKLGGETLLVSDWNGRNTE